MTKKPCKCPAHGKDGRVLTIVRNRWEVPLEIIDTCRVRRNNDSTKEPRKIFH